jgi:MFS family permease
VRGTTAMTTVDFPPLAASQAAPVPRAAYRSLAVSVITLSIVYSVWYSYSVFLVALLHEFGWSRSVVAGAFSVFTLAHGASNPVLGWLADRVGPRRVIATGGAVLALALWSDSMVTTPWQLYLTFGGFTAIGVAAAGWTPAVVLVQRHFTERLGLALGIAGAGIGLGIFLVVPLCQVLIQAFGWRWAFRALSGLCVVWIVPATWFLVREARTRPRELPSSTVRTTAGSPAAPSDLSLAVVVVTLPFWLLAAATFLGNVCSQTLHVHQAAFLVDHGVTPMLAASVVSVVGASSIIGKTGGGWLSDFFPREVIYVIGMACMMVSIAILLGVTVRPTPWLAYAYAVPFGAGYSVTASLMPALLSDRFRGRHFGAIFGATQIAGAIGSALAAWLAGRIFDATGSYVAPFALAWVAALVAAIAVWASRQPRRPY